MFVCFLTRKCPCWAEDPPEPGAAGSVTQGLSWPTESIKKSHLYSPDSARLQHGDEGAVSDCIQVCLPKM